METTVDQDVLAAQAGDREAFTRLVDAYKTVVSSIVTAILRDVTASEDVAQEVFLSAWQGLGRLRNPASFLPWLRQMSRNQAHYFARSRSRQARRLVAPQGEHDLLATVADPSPTAGQKLVSEQENQLLAKVMDELPNEAREVIILYYREGRSARQVAELLGLREDAVKKRLERTRSVLRQEMLDRFGEAAKRTTPGAALTASVAAALVAAAPSNAAAATTATFGSGTVAKALGALGKIAIGLMAIGVGLVGGLTGVFLSLRSGTRVARDERERRKLRKLAMFSGVLMVIFCFGVQVSAMLESSALLVGLWLIQISLQGYLYLKRLPEIVRRRHETEQAGDPDAWRRHRRELRKARHTFLFGATCGTATIVYAAHLIAAHVP